MVVGDQQTEVTVAGQPTDSGGREVYDQSWCGEKVGGTTPWQGANWVNWGVYLNSNHAQLAGPIDLSDEIPAGLALDPTTVTLTVDEQTSYRLDEITTAYPASQLTVTGNRLQAHLSAAEFSGHQFPLGYLTRILTTAGAEFVDQVTETYQLPGQAPQGFTYQTQVRSIAFDATVTGVQPGNLKIIKQYQDGAKRKPLAEATFVIINPVTTQVWVEKTNAQGIIELTNVPAGTYVVREIVAPAFIDLTKVKDQEWQIKVSASEAGQALVIVNEKKPVDEVDQGTGTDEATTTETGTTTDPVETTDAATEGTSGIDAGVGTDEVPMTDAGTEMESGIDAGTNLEPIETAETGTETDESVTSGMESSIDVVTNPEPIETTAPETGTGTSVVRTEPVVVTNNEGALTSGTPTRETGMTVRVKQAGASQIQATGTQASLPQTGPTTAWLSSLSGWGLLGLLGTQRKRRLQ